ncbi:MAG: VCBS repeat-containing protein [Planctomycetes bacterium]|nr:VCBS repeat-containing protein [Planctomycetota bacterium]
MLNHKRVKISLLVVLLTCGFIGYNAISGTDNPVVISDNVLTFAVGDVNSDTYPDIIVGVNDSPQTHNIRLFLNNKNGTFSDASSSLAMTVHPPEVPTVPHIIKLADINNDGLPDIIVVAHNKRNPHNAIFINQGNGIFYESDTIIDKAFSTTSALALTFQDIDNDNIDEIILSNPTGSVIFSNKGGYYALAPELVPPTISPEKPLTSIQVDLDNNGTLETLQVKDRHLTVTEQAAEPKGSKTSLSLNSATVSALANPNGPTFSISAVASDGTLTDTLKADVNDIVYVQLRGQPADY